MDCGAQSRVADSPPYLSVDFGSSNCLELSEMLRSFAELCMARHVGRVLLKAGDNDPEAHRGLSESLLAMARSARLLIDFKLALVPSTPPIRDIYRQAQQELRAFGLNAWVFERVEEAAQWLEGRSPAGPASS